MKISKTASQKCEEEISKALYYSIQANSSKTAKPQQGFGVRCVRFKLCCHAVKQEFKQTALYTKGWFPCEGFSHVMKT